MRNDGNFPVFLNIIPESAFGFGGRILSTKKSPYMYVIPDFIRNLGPV